MSHDSHPPEVVLVLTVLAQSPGSGPTDALYNFRLLSALRADDVSAVQPFLEGLQGGDPNDREIRTGRLLGMAIRIASGGSSGSGCPRGIDANV